MDLRPTYQLQRYLTAHERRYLIELRKAYREIRTELAAIQRPTRQQIIRGTEEWERQARVSARAHSDEVAETLADYAEYMALLAGVAVYRNLYTNEIRETLFNGVSDSAGTIRAQMLGVININRGATDEELRALLWATGLQTGRASAWRRGKSTLEVAGQLALWAAAAAVINENIVVINNNGPEKFQKQVVATIDGNTTDCCLRAHGQIQSMGKPFRLSGTPKFSSSQQSPPFHWNCRSTTAIYHKKFEETGETTQDMRSTAQLEQAARKNK